MDFKRILYRFFYIAIEIGIIRGNTREIGVFWTPISLNSIPTLPHFHIQKSSKLKSWIFQEYPEVVKSMRRKKTLLYGDFTTGLSEDLKAILRLEDEKQPLGRYEDLSSVNPELLRISLGNIFSIRRNVKQSRGPHSARHLPGEYIFRKMGRSGLLTMIHNFQYKEFFSLGNNKMRGSNIIGIIPGQNYNTTKDEPILIGAHWDTYGDSPGYNDNGSGVASLLEIARVLASSKCFKPTYSIIFVAFDAEENGCHGSLHFVRDFIYKNYISNKLPFKGAYILDTILNFDERPDSQEFSQEFEELLPELVEKSRQNEDKGDFILTISRSKHPNDVILYKTFQKHYSSLRNKTFRQENAVLHELPGEGTNPDIKTLIKHAPFWSSDNSRFWYFYAEEHPSVPISTGACWITDTASLRGYMRSCYHTQCDREQSNHKRAKNNIRFMAKTTQALIFAVMELSTEDSFSAECIKAQNEMYEKSEVH